MFSSQQKKLLQSQVQDIPRLFWLLSDIRALLGVFFNPLTTFNKTRGNPGKPFLFIIGSGRSGNTLLRRLLMERLSIYIPPETYVLPKIADYRIRAKNLEWRTFVDLTVSSFEYYPEFETFNIPSLRKFATEAKSWPPEQRNLSDLLQGIYCHFSESAEVDSTWLGDKTPLNTLHIGRINRIIPNANYIYLLRDGVDVAKSYVNAGIYEHLEDAATRWVRSHKSWEAFRKKLPEDRHLQVRYEDLVSSPEENVNHIASHFGIPQREPVAQLESLLGDVEQRSHHSNVTQAPTPGSIGKGRSEVSEDDAKRLRPVLSTWLRRYGYEPI
ncbi:sulfotransferase family protein [Halospina denitrificans]|uniref:Sulfotransferase family protein n=1 Tax=Halospina denitrificans TaxID=332522 RepID=A0A4R7JY69_9GAMM|nr:sulfotransferase [Halospina denitrificans]TDT43450.1 sulfotransferase family protein [Halospina denitrificans]